MLDGIACIRSRRPFYPLPANSEHNAARDEFSSVILSFEVHRRMENDGCWPSRRFSSIICKCERCSCWICQHQVLPGNRLTPLWQFNDIHSFLFYVCVAQRYLNPLRHFTSTRTCCNCTDLALLQSYDGVDNYCSQVSRKHGFNCMLANDGSLPLLIAFITKSILLTSNPTYFILQSTAHIDFEFIIIHSCW